MTEREQQFRDIVADALNREVLKTGGQALWRATGTEAVWAQTPSVAMPTGTARMLANLQRRAGNEHSAEILDRSWMENEKSAAKEFVDYAFDQFTLWAITERPDLLKTCREIINDALPPEERL